MNAHVDAIRAYDALDFATEYYPLPSDTVEKLRSIKARTNPEIMADELAATLRILWGAVASGDYNGTDVASALAAAAEHAELISVAANVNRRAAEHLHEHAQAKATSPIPVEAA